LTGLELVFQLLLLADARQSQYILDRPGEFREHNPLVRKYGVKKYFLTAAVGHALVTANLPREYVPMWQYGTIGVQAFVVGRNAHIGVRMTF
jgi:hypothetical protein